MSKSNFSLRNMVAHRYGDSFPDYVDSLTTVQEERDFLFHFALYCHSHHPSWLIEKYNIDRSLHYGRK